MNKHKFHRRRTFLKATATVAIPYFIPASVLGKEPAKSTGQGVVKDAFIARTIESIDQKRLKDDVFYLAKDPLPMRKLNLTLPGHEKNTLYEADDYLTAQLEACKYKVQREAVRVHAVGQAEPWYTSYNLYAERLGRTRPKEIILLLAHKDSQSWVDSPGAYDNTGGTAAVVELARLVAALEPQRTIRFLLCNEEHLPWTSVTAAQNARGRGDNLVAVFNLDGLGGKSQKDIDAGAKTSVTMYTVDEGKALADLMTQVNEVYRIGLRHRIGRRGGPGDDDGSFVNAGYGRTVLNIGSFPYVDPEYHRPGDVPERVDFENVRMQAQATLAAVLEVDRKSVDHYTPRIPRKSRTQ